MVALWQPGAEITATILGSEPHDFIELMLKGTTEFLQVELAGERMRLALTLHDPEEEHDCFSDQTHRSHYYNLDGVVSVFTGAYHPTPGLPEELTESHAAQFREATHLLALYKNSSEAQVALEASERALATMYDAAEAGQTFDTLIAEGDVISNQIVQSAISELLILSFALEALLG